MFIPFDRSKFEGMERPRPDAGPLIHELHHLIDERKLTESSRATGTRDPRRVMKLRQLAASDRSLRAGALTKGAIEAVVWDEYGQYQPDYAREGNRLTDLRHASEDHPMLTEAEIQKFWPEFRMPARRPGRGSFTR